MLTRIAGAYVLVALACAVSPSPAAAVVIYNEAISGDLSNNGLSPTPLSVSLGSNEVLGVTGRTDGVVDRDYFNITVPGGAVLSAITVLPGTMPGAAVSFIAIQAGNQVTVPTDTTTAAGLLGFKLYQVSDINSDILDDIGASGNGSSGFTPPLGAGSYAFWVQELAVGRYPYGFDLVLRAATAVPEPSSAAAAMVGLVAAGLTRRRRAKAQLEA